ncbi:MAG: hypothetical protein WCK15_18080, partial [Pirellula sp.]
KSVVPPYPITTSLNQRAVTRGAWHVGGSGYQGWPAGLAGKPERSAARGCGIQIPQACPVDYCASWLPTANFLNPISLR